MGFEPDPTTYTENDVVGDRIQNILADSADAVGVQRTEVGVNLGKSQGPIFGEIPGDGIRWKVSISAITGVRANLYCPILSNETDKDAFFYESAGVGRECILTLFQRQGSGNDAIVLIFQKAAGGLVASTYIVPGGLVGKTHWCELTRNAAKTSTTLRLFDADTFDVADLVRTSPIAGTPDTTFSIHYWLTGRGAGFDTTGISGIVSEYDFTWVTVGGLATNPLKSAIFGEIGVLAV